MINLKEHYRTKVISRLMKDLRLSNIHQVPKIKKITLNMGVGEAVNDKKIVDKAVDELRCISGQQPVVTKVRKSIAGFKIREGWPIGCKVTLRGHKMYNFIEKLIYIAIPRIRDFRGLNSKAFDKQGNYSIGITEQVIFPEIDYDNVDNIRGLDICITTSATNKEQGLALLLAMYFPIKEA